MFSNYRVTEGSKSLDLNTRLLKKHFLLLPVEHWLHQGLILFFWSICPFKQTEPNFLLFEFNPVIWTIILLVPRYSLPLIFFHFKSFMFILLCIYGTVSSLSQTAPHPFLKSWSHAMKTSEVAGISKRLPLVSQAHKLWPQYYCVTQVARLTITYVARGQG